MAHIGIDARLIDYRIGGISTYIRRLVAAFDQMTDQPHRLSILRSRKSSTSVTTHFAERKIWTPPHHRWERLALSAELFRYRLDVLHSTDFIPPLRGARRHVINVYDLTFLHYPQHKDRGSQRYYNSQIQRAVKQADHILTISQASKRDIIDLLDVSPHKVTVHLLGVDERFVPLPERIITQWRTALDLPENYVLFVGTFEPRKNIPLLLEAYADLSTDLRERFPLLLVGRPGWLFDTTMQRIEQLQTQGYPILIRSDISDEALPAIYNMASVLVLPSFYEGFGIPPLEAMACGTPTIVSDISSLPEVVGDVGLLIDPNDSTSLTTALERALTDSEWRRSARARGLHRAKSFTWEQVAQTTLSVYQQVL